MPRQAAWLCAALLFEFLRLEVGGQRLDERLQLAFHHLIQLMQREADAVIRNAILREIIGADLLAAVAGAHHAAPLRADFFLLLLELHLVEPRTQHAHGLARDS